MSQLGSQGGSLFDLSLDQNTEAEIECDFISISVCLCAAQFVREPL